MGKWKFSKKPPKRQPKRVIVIAAEGRVTENEYFNCLNRIWETNVFTIVKNAGNQSSPHAVLKRMKNYLDEYPLRKNDEAWIVIDRDDWKEENIENIRKWTQENKEGKYHLAISERRFEDWLKLHVEGDKTAKKQYRPTSDKKDKHIPDGFVTKERVLKATERAKELYSTPKSVGNVFEIIDSFFRS